MPELASKAVENALGRVEETEPKIHAFVHVLRQHAQETAIELDARNEHGPLYGLCFGAKEVFDIAGVETTGGCKVFSGRTPATDATVIARLRRAGAVLLGTQVSHELTCGLDQPPTRNPWKLTHYPGGSSAGAGASVSVGSVDFALGTDAAGSIRIPAAMTGTVGFKPTMGMVSKFGVMREASAPSIDNVGIVARKVMTVESVFRILRNPDAGDPQSLVGNQCDSPLRSVRETQTRGLRIGVLGDRTLNKLNNIYPLENDILHTFQLSCARMKAAGLILVEIDPPGWETAISSIMTLFSAELAHAHRNFLAPNRPKYHPDIGKMLEEGLHCSEEILDNAVSSRVTLTLALMQNMTEARIDFVATPTTTRAAMSLDSFKPGHELASLIAFTCVSNLTGMPAISLPHGFTTTGLPLGLQLFGRRHADDSVLVLARELERVLAIS